MASFGVSKLDQMAFVGQETLRKQHRLNSLRGIYTLMAVYVDFNCFIDLTVNFHSDS